MAAKSNRLRSLTEFLEWVQFSRVNWIAKRLSGNDTGLTEAHQAGLYLPLRFMRLHFPEINTVERRNPDTELSSFSVTNCDYTQLNIRAIYYNSRCFGVKNGRNEFRLTRWGGETCPLQNPENTGAIFVFALLRDEVGSKSGVGWLCKTSEEEKLFEDWIGNELFPGDFIGSADYMDLTPIRLRKVKTLIKQNWHHLFPSGHDIFAACLEAVPHTAEVDSVLLRRRQLEYDLFLEIEKQHVLPILSKGFSAVDDFIALANSVTNRRKSRTGKSLELNLEAIFKAEKVLFETQAVTENKKRPDFLFPSQYLYDDRRTSEACLDMLGAKTCCKDRWRQILNEADRIKKKHLFTLQEGVSVSQMREMKDSNVVLVVPRRNVKKFPEEVRGELLDLRTFIDLRLAKQNILRQ